jgi:hypothetical protein
MPVANSGELLKHGLIHIREQNNKSRKVRMQRIYKEPRIWQARIICNEIPWEDERISVLEST